MNNGIFLLLGTNLGDRLENLSLARDHLARAAGPVAKASAVYQTAPWGNTDQPEFYNQVLKVDTTSTPRELLTIALAIEQQMGRIREVKWGARIIDIDILFYNNQVVNEPDLVLPHPGIPLRRFTLVPLAEIAGDFVHPILNKTCKHLLRICADSSKVDIVAKLEN